VALDRSSARAASRKNLSSWIAAGAGFERALQTLLGQAHSEVQAGRPPTKVAKKTLDQLSRLIKQGRLPGEIQERGGRRHEVTICVPEALDASVSFILVSGSINGRNGAINLTRRQVLTASQHVLERLHQRLETMDSFIVLQEVYSCLVAAVAMDDAARTTRAQHWPLSTTNGLFVCAPAEDGGAMMLVTWMRYDQLGKKWGCVAEDLRAANAASSQLLHDRDFCVELLRLHSWLLRPHAPGEDIAAVWWASRPQSEQEDEVREFEVVLGEPGVDSAMPGDDDIDSASVLGELSTPDVALPSSPPWPVHQVKAREQYTGIVVQVRISGARIIALQNGFFGVLRQCDRATACHDSEPIASLQLGARITVEVLRVVGDVYTGPYSIALQLPDVADALWSAAQQRHLTGSIVSGTIVWRGVGGSVVAIAEGASGWLPDSELSWSKDASSLRGPLAVGQELRLQIIGYANEYRRILLSLRQLAHPPVDWSVVEAMFPVGTIVERPIVLRGARGFVIGMSEEVMMESFSGWLPDSELTWSVGDRSIHRSLEVGQQIRLQVIGHLQEDRRVLLSLRRANGPPVDWSIIETRYPIGSVVDGNVVWRGSGNSIVRVCDDVSGWLSDGELSWSYRDRSVLDSVAVGQQLRLKVIGHEPERRRLSLSLRQVQVHPLNQVDESTFVGTTHPGVVANVVDYGVFVRLPLGVDGLLHKSSLPAGLSLSKGDLIGNLPQPGSPSELLTS
jgi:ribosomal protein S1